MPRREIRLLNEAAAPGNASPRCIVVVLTHPMHRAGDRAWAGGGYSWYENRSSCQGSAELW